MAQQIPKLVKPKPKVIDVDPMQPAQLVRPEPKVIDVPSEDTGSLLGDTASGQRGGLLSRIGGGIGNFLSQIDADIINQVSDQIVSPVLEGYVADRGGDPRNLATYQGRKRREEAAVAAAEEEAKNRLQAQKIAADQLAATRKRLADNQDFFAQAQINQGIKERNERSNREWELAMKSLDTNLAAMTGDQKATRDLFFDAIRKDSGLDSSSSSSSAGITPSTAASAYRSAFDRNIEQQREQIDKVVQYNNLVGSAREKLEVPVLDDKAAHQEAMKMLERTVSAVEGSLRSGTMTASPSTVSTLTRLKENFPKIDAYYGTQQFPKMLEQVESLISSASEDVTPTPTAADIVGRSTYTSPDGLQIYTVDPSTGSLSVRDNRAAVGVEMAKPQLMNAELNKQKYEDEKNSAQPAEESPRNIRSERLAAKADQVGSWVNNIARLNNEGMVEVGYADWLTTTNYTQEDFDNQLRSKLGSKRYQMLRDNAIRDPVSGRTLYEDKIQEVSEDIYRADKIRQLKRRVSPASIRSNLDTDEKKALITKLVGRYETDRAKEVLRFIAEQRAAGRSDEQIYNLSLGSSEYKGYVKKNELGQTDPLVPSVADVMTPDEFAKLKQDLFVEWSNAEANSVNETISLELAEFMDRVMDVRVKQLEENPDLRDKVAMRIVDPETGEVGYGSSLLPQLDESGNFILAYNPEVTDQINMIAEDLGMDEADVQSVTNTTPQQALVDKKDEDTLASFENNMRINAGRPEIFSGERKFQLGAMKTLVGLKEDSRLDQDTLDQKTRETITAFNVLREMVAEESGTDVEEVGGAELSGLLDMRVLRLMQHNASKYKSGLSAYKHIIEQVIRSKAGAFDGKRTFYGSLEREQKAKIGDNLVEIPFSSNEREFEVQVDELEAGTLYIDVDGFFYKKKPRSTKGKTFNEDPLQNVDASYKTLRNLLEQYEN